MMEEENIDETEMPTAAEQPNYSPEQTEVDEEYQVPESISDFLTLTKQDLRTFLEPLPQEIMTSIEKLKNAERSDDFASIKATLPLFCASVTSFVSTKKRDLQNVEGNILKILNDFENRALKAEEKNGLYEKLVQSLNKKNGLLQDKARELYEERIKDLKEDPIRQTTEQFLREQLDELNAMKSLTVKMIPDKTEDVKPRIIHKEPPKQAIQEEKEEKKEEEEPKKTQEGENW
jgi:hypothetical protein